MTAPARLLLDMVHHNPGEPLFTSRFTAPAALAALGYTGQVMKHLNACVAFPDPADGGFPSTPEETAWLHRFAADRDAEIVAAQAAGVDSLYHVDFFVLPKRVIEARRAEICDADGRVDVTRPATLDLHRKLLDHLFARFPGVRGLVVRVGETYLFDTPYHSGNTAVPLHDDRVSREEQMRRFLILVNFLREEICVRHGRLLVYRTWDYFGDRFHAAPDFYQRVTDAVEPHPLLVFSIKHTAGDFFRGCRPNPCLGLGRHPQIVEVQCQREYEGKGAYPCYIARGVVEGFPEIPGPALGLRDWARSPLFRGLFTWSRGGGWFGPYPRHEFWPEFNLRVLASWSHDPSAPEETHFARVCAEFLGCNAASTRALREICQLAERAVWLGRSGQTLGELDGFRDADVAKLWMRDDRLGGLKQVEPLFAALHAGGRLAESIAEKHEAARLFAAMIPLAERVQTSDSAARAALIASAHHGARLFAWIACGWELMAKRWLAARGEGAAPTSDELARYRELRAAYQRLPAERPLSSSLYVGDYWNWPGQPATPGMDASVLG